MPNSDRIVGGSETMMFSTRIAEGQEATEMLASFFRDLKMSVLSLVEQNSLKLSDLDLRRSRWYRDLSST